MTAKANCKKPPIVEEPAPNPEFDENEEALFETLYGKEDDDLIDKDPEQEDANGETTEPADEDGVSPFDDEDEDEAPPPPVEGDDDADEMPEPDPDADDDEEVNSLVDDDESDEFPDEEESSDEFDDDGDGFDEEDSDNFPED